VALVVFPGFQALDLAALTVFEMANLECPRPRYRVEVVSEAGGPVGSSAGVAVQTRPLARAGAFDTLLVAGALVPGTCAPGLLKALRRAAAQARRVASLCTGAFVLAEAGLLAGRRATTHWAHARELQRRCPQARVEEDQIYVQDGPVWSSAGMSACIDLALALVDADLGPQVARTVSRKMVVYHRRTGGQSQFSVLSELQPASDRIRDVLAYAREHLREPLSVEQLAAQVHWSPRHFSRAFRLETGHSPAKAVERLRLEAARELIEAGHESIARIADATGFGDEERMRRAFIRVFGKPPQALIRELRERQEAPLGLPA
jgi:transcriptional regulator GlxA family with amidase domain